MTISNNLVKNIKPKESIILNVVCVRHIPLSSKSVLMSQDVDITGERTFVVVTKCDTRLYSELETFIANKLNLHPNYIFVTNQFKDEMHAEARIREAKLFEKHPVLSRINKSMVGNSILAYRLNKIQLMMISKYLSEIHKKINEKLNALVLELNELSPNLMSIPHGIIGFMHIVGIFEESLLKILIKSEFDEYMNDKEMHGNARLAEMFDQFSEELQTSIIFPNNFLVEEIEVLEQANSTRLPYFFPHSVSFLARKKSQ